MLPRRGQGDDKMRSGRPPRTGMPETQFTRLCPTYAFLRLRNRNVIFLALHLASCPSPVACLSALCIIWCSTILTGFRLRCGPTGREYSAIKHFEEIQCQQIQCHLRKWWGPWQVGWPQKCLGGRPRKRRDSSDMKNPSKTLPKYWRYLDNVLTQHSLSVGT